MSNFGPFIYVFDMKDSVNSMPSLFADDAKLLSKSTLGIAYSPQSDLDLLRDAV